MRYKPNLTFSQPVYSMDYIGITILPNWELYANELRQAEKWFRDNGFNSAIGITNVATKFHTPYLSHTMTNLFDNIHDKIHAEIMGLERECRGIQNSDIKDYLKVGECWLASYEEGDATAKHFHYPYHMVSTFYYDVEISTPLIIEYYDDEGFQQKSIDVTDGLLLMIPGQMMHSVPTCKGPRSMLASNWYYDLTTYNIKLAELQKDFLQKNEKKT